MNRGADGWIDGRTDRRLDGQTNMGTGSEEREQVDAGTEMTLMESVTERLLSKLHKMN